MLLSEPEYSIRRGVVNAEQRVLQLINFGLDPRRRDAELLQAFPMLTDGIAKQAVATERALDFGDVPEAFLGEPDAHRGVRNDDYDSSL